MREYITPSMLKTHSQCPYGYWLKYHEGLVPRVKRSSEVFGNYIHLTIQKWLKQEVKNPEEFFVNLWDKVKDILVYPEREDGESLKEIGLKILSQIPQVVASLEIIEIEQPYERKLPIGLLKGTPDIIAIQNGEKVVLDWKITKSLIEGKEKIDPQLKMYSYLTGITKGGYIYIKRNKNPEIVFSPVVDIIVRQEDIMLWSEQVVLMEEGPFYKNVSFFCGMCEYLPICCEEPDWEVLFERQEIPDRYAGVSCKRIE
ncbi:MAG: PD-(D/E)XK nuclease family protein [Candidatus Micrarchaeia archaeon]